MAVEASVFCAAECGNRAALPAGQITIEPHGVGLPSPWRMVIVETRHWAVCSAVCEQKLDPARLRELYEERVAQFKIGNAHRRHDD